MVRDNKESIYIPNLQSKDIYIAINNPAKSYNLKNKENKYNLNRFNYSFDWSKELEQLIKVYKSVYRRKDFDFSVVGDDKLYSTQLINVNFNYSVKKFNQINKTTYVKFGYDPSMLVWDDCLAFYNDILVGVKVDTPVKEPKDLSKYESRVLNNKDKHGDTVKSLFNVEIRQNKGKKETIYKIDKNENTTVKTKKNLFNELYVNGFDCNGVHYVRYMRSCGASRQGKCLFINERLYSKIQKWDSMGIDLSKEIEIAAYETYKSLASSSSIDKLYIDPKSILVIPEYHSLFKDTVVVTTKDENDFLQTDIAEIEISNNTWDGQSLIDFAAMDKYKEFGMVLLRERMFKAACFNTNLQQWFRDNSITELSQLHPESITLAESITDIKLVITKSCCKYEKFGAIEEWLKKIDGWFYIVKTEHETKFFENKKVQSHYQLWNTLQLSKEETKDGLQSTIDYIELLNTDNDVFKHHINYKQSDFEDNTFNPLLTNNDKVNVLSSIKGFDQTKLYYEYKRQTINSFYDNIYCGHSLINGCYAVLFGNPLSMLKQTINKFDENSEFEPNTLMTTYYPPSKEIVGCRSPHVAAGNLLLATNVYIDDINKYFNLTDNIVCINSIKENTLERLSSADFDSDQMIITDEPLTVSATKKNYNKFLVPTSEVKGDKELKEYTLENIAALDCKNSELTMLIGEIINFSQVLNSKIWHDLNNGKSFNDINDIYKDVCQLDVMSCLCIDMAKKTFGNLNLRNELDKLRKKYRDPKYDMIMKVKDKDGNVKTKLAIPSFFNKIDNLKGYKKTNYKHYDTTMCYITDIMKKNKSSDNKPAEFTPLSKVFMNEKYDIKGVNYLQKDEIINMAKQANSEIKKLFKEFNEIKNKTKEDTTLLYRDIQKYKYVLFKYVNAKKINIQTMCRILEEIEDNDNKEHYKLLFYTMINTGNNTFLNLLKDNKEKIYELVQLHDLDDSDECTYLYNIPHKKVQKNA